MREGSLNLYVGERVDFFFFFFEKSVDEFSVECLVSKFFFHHNLKKYIGFFFFPKRIGFLF